MEKVAIGYTWTEHDLNYLGNIELSRDARLCVAWRDISRTSIGSPFGFYSEIPSSVDEACVNPSR